MSPKNDYTKLRQLLNDQETFPIRYVHKFIGKNTPAFNQAVEDFEKKFPGIERQSARTSSGDAHVAMTYALEANSADEVVRLYEATETIPDLLIIL